MLLDFGGTKFPENVCPQPTQSRRLPRLFCAILSVGGVAEMLYLETQCTKVTPVCSLEEEGRKGDYEGRRRNGLARGRCCSAEEEEALGTV